MVTERDEGLNEHWNAVEKNLTNAWQQTKKTTKRQEIVYRALGLEI